MMAVRRIGPDAHASDGELVRLLDGEGEAAERTRVQAHAGACPECTSRLGRQRRRSARLSLLLSESDPDLDRRAATLRLPVAMAWRSRRPPRPGMTYFLRAAAVLAGLVALGWVVQPVRAWIVARWAALTAPRVVVVHPTARPAPAPAPEATTSVAFVPGTADFVVAFEAKPAGGRLSVRVTGGDRLTLASTGRADVLVLPGELRIRNATSSSADYRVEVPPGVTRLRVRIGERTVLDATPSPISAGWTIDLARGASAR